MAKIKNIFSKRWIRFLLTGGMAFITEYLSFLLLFYGFNSNIILANGASFMLGLFTSFFLNKVWVFENKNKSSLQLFTYIMLAIINLIFSSFAIKVLSGILEPGIAKILIVMIIATWNFIIYKLVIFK